MTRRLGEVLNLRSNFLVAFSSLRGGIGITLALALKQIHDEDSWWHMANHVIKPDANRDAVAKHKAVKKSGKPAQARIVVAFIYRLYCQRSKICHYRLSRSN